MDSLPLNNFFSGPSPPWILENSGIKTFLLFTSLDHTCNPVYLLTCLLISIQTCFPWDNSLGWDRKKCDAKKVNFDTPEDEKKVLEKKLHKMAGQGRSSP